jgi:TRAP-type C4-dicarboxylate transport system substrate-binding protein
MKRREFIKLCASSAAVGATVMPGTASAQAVVWKASDVHPLGYPTVEAIVRMGKKLEKETNGRITIQMYPLMQLGGEKEMIEQAQVGALQIARISVGAMGPVVDELNVFNLPFIFRDEAHMRKVIDGPSARSCWKKSRPARSPGWWCWAGWTPAPATSTRTSR